MYAMVGKLTVQPGTRDKMVEILKSASKEVAQMSGCQAYIVNEDLGSDTTVWVFEIWDDKEKHDESLKAERVKSLIAEAMPFMGGAPDGAELRVVGGHGLAI